MKNVGSPNTQKHSVPTSRWVRNVLSKGQALWGQPSPGQSGVESWQGGQASWLAICTTDTADDSVPLAFDLAHSMSPINGRCNCKRAYAPASCLSLLALCPSRCNPCPALVIVGARESHDSPFNPSKKISPDACIPHQRGSRFSGQRWRRAVRESAACADQSLPSTCQQHAGVRSRITAGRWCFGLISVFC